MSGPLLRHVLESTLLCLLLGAAACTLRRQAAAARHTLWLVGISKFLVPIAVLTATGARIAVVLPATAWIAAIAAQISSLLVSLFSVWPSQTFMGGVTDVSFALLTIWLLGSAVMFVTWFIRLRMSYAVLRPARAEEWRALDCAKQKLGWGAVVELRSSSRLREPAVTGFFRPTITLPQDLSHRLTVPELHAVLLHELAHARRRDNLVGAYVHGVVSVFWFHPLLWFVEKQLLAERERACDETVIHCGTAPQVYVSGLLKVCRFHLFEDVAGVSNASGSNLACRFDQILSCRMSKPVPAMFRILVAGLAVFVTLLPVAGGYCEQCGTSHQAVTKEEAKTAVSQYSATGRRFP